MWETRTRFLVLNAGALVALFAAAPSFGVRAQDKDKDAQKPAAITTTADAWRQALPPESVPDASAAEVAGSVATPRAAREETEKSLIALERKWMESLKLRDASALSQIVSDDFTFADSRLSGAVRDRTKYFDHALRDLKLASYEFDDINVRLYGRVAIVSGQFKQSATVAGEDWGGDYFFTDVWVNREGVWRAVSRHASLLPAKK